MSLANLFHHGHGPHKKLCKFEIRLDNDFVVLRGSEHETPDFAVSGAVVLMNTEPIQTKGIWIELQGKRRTMFFPNQMQERPPGANAPIVNKANFLTERSKLDPPSQEVRSFKPGNHELPFCITVPGSTSESIEGMASNFVSYDLRAVADRGLMAKDLVARKHLRIIRTLGPDPVELVDPQQVSGFWPDKIKYEFNTSSRAAIFGTKVVTNIELTPLMEKLRIGKIRVTLKEVRKIRTVPGHSNDASGMWKTESPVKELIMDAPEAPNDQDPQLHLPMYKIKSSFDLPKSLRDCRQSVENNDWIKIKHLMYFDILLHNPDGHLSELRAHYAIRLFISPSLPLDEDSTVAQNSGSEAPGEHLLEDLQTAPPDYSHHQLDPLYDGIDSTGFMTPFPQSGVNTPGLSFSRRGSNEQLSLDQVTERAFHEDLRQRLANLSPDSDADLAQRTQHMRLHPGTGHGSPHSGPQSSGSPSRSNSFFDLASMGSSGMASPLHHGVSVRRADYDETALSRMPSYDTAVRSNARATEMPPTYRDAQSQPPTPPSEPHHHSSR